MWLHINVSWLFYSKWRITILAQCVLGVTTSKRCYVYSAVNYELKCWLNVLWVWQQVNIVMLTAVNCKMVDNYVLDVWMAQQANVVTVILQ
jgi:hypothetical protein